MFGEREIRGWFEAPSSLVERLVQKGLPERHPAHRQDCIRRLFSGVVKRFFSPESLLYSIFNRKFENPAVLRIDL